MAAGQTNRDAAKQAEKGLDEALRETPSPPATPLLSLRSKPAKTPIMLMNNRDRGSANGGGPCWRGSARKTPTKALP